MISLCGSTPEEVLDYAGTPDIGLSGAVKVLNCIYKKRIQDISLIPGVSRKLKGDLAKTFITGFYKPASFRTSADGSVKYLFRNDGGLVFEAVYLPEEKRNTVCVSSQSGCRMGCPFCVTGKYGFHGNLAVRDIINQVLSLPESEKVTHVVFMGMGEPMDNLGNVLKACTILTAEWGLALGRSHVTVSTVGITPGVKKFLEGSDCNMALSLFSPFPEERTKVVPVEKNYPVLEIIQMMKNPPAGKRRRMTVAYMMIKGVNDSDKHLAGLKNLLAGSGIRINLLPYHNIPGDRNISSDPVTMQYFRHELVMSGISASIRKSRGVDVSAACGLLASFG